ncbi:MAG: glycosyltransferase family 39 protein [Saccharofermentans sp.]|nr:glycosyltransferase family 39 protein [Saccharofermentans sp.]
MEKNKLKVDNSGITAKQWIIFAGACVAMFFIYTFALFNNNITYDSVYEYFLIKHSFAEMWQLIPEDYSPPFYSVSLKLFASVFGYSLPVLRFFSYFAFVGMMFLAVFPVKKLFGEKASYVATVLLLTSTVNYVYSVDIRPATYAYFFSTAVVIYSMLAQLENKTRYYVILCIFSVLAVYTHYVSLIFAFVIYLICIVYCLIKKNFKQILKYLVCGVVITVSYAPWLVVLLGQTKNVQEHFWVDPDNSSIISAFLNVFIKPYRTFDFGDLFLIGFAVLSITMIALVVMILKHRLGDNKERLLLLWAEIFIPLIVFQIVIVDVFKIPAPRYYYIFSGAALIGIAVIASIAFEKKIILILLGVLCGINCVMNCIHMYKIRNDDCYEKLVADLNAAAPEEGLVFLHNHEYSMGIFSYYFPDAAHFIHDDTYTVIRDFDVFPTNIRNVGDASNIWNYADEEVFFAVVYYPNSIIEIEGDGISYDCAYADECEYNNDFIIFHYLAE